MTDDVRRKGLPAKKMIAGMPKWWFDYTGAVKVISLRREKLGLTQAMVAAKIGISLRSYQRKETCDGEFTMLQFYQVANLLGLTISLSDEPTDEP